MMKRKEKGRKKKGRRKIGRNEEVIIIRSKSGTKEQERTLRK